MKLYILKDVKELFKKANTHIKRKELEDFFCNQNIYNNLSINNIYINKKISNVSYISEDDLARISLIASFKFNSNFDYSKFKFGKSISIKVNEIEDIINSTLENTDYLILHGSSAELKIFRDNNIQFPETLKVLDTQLIVEKHFQDKIIRSSLKSSIKAFGLQKSGNDAAYTMNLFNTMVKKIKLTFNLDINQNKYRMQI